MKTHDLFSNVARVSTNLHEVLIQFGRVSPASFEAEADDDGAVPAEVDRVSRIRLGHAHAKTIATILVRQLISFERRHGVNVATSSEVQDYWARIVEAVGDLEPVMKDDGA